LTLPTAARLGEGLDMPNLAPRVQLGLYALKPWYAGKLEPVLQFLARADVSPDTVSAAGILAAGLGGAALALLPAGPLTGVLVAIAAAARLAAANLDGNLARRTGRTSRWGGVVNEIGDRVADLALLAGLAVHLPPLLGGLLLLAATAPSWVALAGAAQGAPRLNGGPVGKTERCLLTIGAAATGWYVPAAVVILAGSALTAVVRALAIRSSLR
jgi:CDP-diacylglycerol--glycerol-3-phosphate 3-phosphatidyltransferase